MAEGIPIEELAKIIEEILNHQCKEETMSKIRRMKAKRVRFNEMQAINAQAKVMAGYVLKFNLIEKDQEYLHMFFSPYRVPKGLTRGEVIMAILLRKNAIGKAQCWGRRRSGYNLKITRSGFLKMIGEMLRQGMTDIVP